LYGTLFKLKKASMNQQKLTHQREAWQNIWKRRGVMNAVINAGRTVYNWFFRRYLRMFITPETRFLELGSGTATLALSIAPQIKELVGIDNAESAILLSRKNADAMNIQNSRFELADCLALPYENEFDVVWSQGLMEHFDDPVAVAAQHYKAAKSGGIALISIPYRYSYHAVWYFLTRPRFLRSLWPWTDQIFYTKAQLLDIGRKVTPLARTHFLQPFPFGIIILELPK
jgi:SAM-dependent methyltransferase